MWVMFYNRSKDYNTWQDKVIRIVNNERSWDITKKLEAGNEIELHFSKRIYQLMEIRQ